MSLARLHCLAAAVILTTAAPALAEKGTTDRFARASNGFALDLYQRLRPTAGNLFFSPASVAAALTMTWAGARGETAAQMRAVLHLRGAPAHLHAAAGSLLARLAAPGAGTPEVDVANRLWVQRGLALEPAFTRLLERHYGAGAAPIDFVGAAPAARATINRWVAERTAGKIADLLPARALDAEVRFVLTNAVYFKGEWRTPFAPAATRPGEFTVRPGTTRRVPLMHAVLHKPQARFAAVEGAELLELPYRSARRDRALALVVVLPTAVDGLAAVEEKLTPARLERWLAALAPTAVRAALPRFGVSQRLRLGETLSAMGMKQAFSRRSGDFTGITRQEPLCLARVVHQAFVQVNEAGTEAGAATAVVGIKRNGGGPRHFRADHPFLFFIRDLKSGAILFLGRLVDPAAPGAAG